ncbi:MAG: M16 family metallopeptidase [Alphaproteobacteria bacterium]
MFKKIILIISFILISCNLLAADTITQSEEFKLKNGMKVVLIPNHKTPAISHMVWYNVGSVNDPLGKSGLAHFLEHMMFKSTANLKEGDFFKKVSENGGELNAFTNLNYTGYYENITIDKLPLVMQLESDRMTKLNLNPEEVIKERQVIIQERHLRYDTNPQALLHEQMLAALYINHPNHRPVIGWRHEMEDLQLEDVRSFYKTYYRPENAVLVVAGDITMEKLKPLAEKYYGYITVPKIKHKEIVLHEPKHIAARRILSCDVRVNIDTLYRSYLTSPTDLNNLSKDFALAIAEYIVGGNKFSRLYDLLVNKMKLATNVRVDYNLVKPEAPGYLDVYIAAKEKVKLSDIERELNKEIDKLINHGVTKNEFEEAKIALSAKNIYDKESFKELGYIYGIMSIYSIPFSYFENWSDNINSISLDQVNSVIKEVFQSTQSVTGLLYNDEKNCKNYVN